MNRTRFALSMGAVLAAAVFAAATFAQSEPTSIILAGGTALNAELNSSLDSKKAKVGDRVEAHTTLDLRSTDGRTVIPKGTKLIGHLTEAAARSKGDSESMLAIQFDKAIPKNGGEIPLRVEIRAIGQPQNDFSSSAGNSGNDPMTSRGAAGGSPMGASRSPSTVPPNTASNPSPDITPRGSSDAGPLPANSRGVYGFSGLQLSTDSSKPNPATKITSTGKNVHLDSGTRLLLIALEETPAADSK